MILPSAKRNHKLSHWWGDWGTSSIFCCKNGRTIVHHTLRILITMPTLISMPVDKKNIELLSVPVRYRDLICVPDDENCCNGKLRWVFNRTVCCVFLSSASLRRLSTVSWFMAWAIFMSFAIGGSRIAILSFNLHTVLLSID